MYFIRANDIIRPHLKFHPLSFNPLLDLELNTTNKERPNQRRSKNFSGIVAVVAYSRAGGQRPM
jgi:hypothetical protein